MIKKVFNQLSVMYIFSDVQREDAIDGYFDYGKIDQFELEIFLYNPCPSASVERFFNLKTRGIHH